MAEQQQESGWLGCCLKGCAVIAVVLIIGGYFVYKKTVEWARNTSADLLEYAATETVKGGKFTEAEAKRFQEPLKKVASRIRAGEVGLSEAKNLGVAFFKSPLIPYMMIHGFEKEYLETSGLSDEEKKQGHVTVSRFARGVFNGKIPGPKIQENLEPISEKVVKDGKTTTRLKPKVSKEELQKCLEGMKKTSNDAGIPEQECAVDLGIEVEKVVRLGLSEQALPAEKAP